MLAPKSIEVEGQEFTYLDQGNGPVLVLLAGWNEDHRMYKRLVPILARRYRVLALDWRGHGERRTHVGDFGIENMANDVVALLERLGVKTSIIVSFSHGGWVNIEACERLGIARVPKAALISWRMTEPGQVLAAWCKQWQTKDLWEQARSEFFQYALGESENQDIIDHIKDEMSSYGEGYWFRTGREIAASYERWRTPLQRLAALSETRAITHIYTLPHDQSYVDEQTEFANKHPWFQPFRLPGETHFPLLESPAAVARLIHEFSSGAS